MNGNKPRSTWDQVGTKSAPSQGPRRTPQVPLRCPPSASLMVAGEEHLGKLQVKKRTIFVAPRKWLGTILLTSAIWFDKKRETRVAVA